jgi:hypothetical protein
MPRRYDRFDREHLVLIGLRIVDGHLRVRDRWPARPNKPSFTNAAACFRLAGVMKFIVPISSSLPQRPQLFVSFFHCFELLSRHLPIGSRGARAPKANAAIHADGQDSHCVFSGHL